eukprot:COSAG01_NODE_1712_length_9409_cov_4.588077_8_plen_333_part_00
MASAGPRPPARLLQVVLIPCGRPTTTALTVGLLLCNLLCAQAAGAPPLPPPRNPTRTSGAFRWCECGTGTRYITVTPDGDSTRAVRVAPFAPSPWLPWRAHSISWLCDGGSTRYEFTAPAPAGIGAGRNGSSLAWWSALLPTPLSNGEPTKPLLCRRPATGQAHVSTWAAASGPAGGDNNVISVPFSTGVGPPTLPRKYACIKIPVLFHTAAGTLLALAESRMGSCSDFAWTDLVVRRSQTGGASWSNGDFVRSEPGQTIGNAAPVQLRKSGRILLPHTLNNSQIWLTYSDTDGASWATPRQVRRKYKPPKLREAVVIALCFQILTSGHLSH